MAPPIKVEYAKSARSRCTLKACNLFILKGELRIGTGSMMPGATDMSYKWRHLCCFSGRQIKNMGASVDNIEGFEDVEEAHQAVIHKMVKGHLDGDASVKGAVISAAIAGSAGDGDDGAGAGGAKKPAKKKAPGVGALLMGNSNADLLTQTLNNTAAAATPAACPAPSKEAGKKRTRATVTTLNGDLVDCGAESDATDDYEVGVTNQKPMCPHGADCYRKAPEHFAQYRHPGDTNFLLPDGVMQPTVIRRITKRGVTAVNTALGDVVELDAFADANTSAVSSSIAPVIQGAFGAFSTEKKPCPYGPLCVLLTPAHRNQYSHNFNGDGTPAAAAPAPSAPAKVPLKVPLFTMKKPPTAPSSVGLPPPADTINNGSAKPPCPYIPMCLRTDAKHLAEYAH